jgi:hypothetical protein
LNFSHPRRRHRLRLPNQPASSTARLKEKLQGEGFR